MAGRLARPGGASQPQAGQQRSALRGRIRQGERAAAMVAACRHPQRLAVTKRRCTPPSMISCFAALTLLQKMVRQTLMTELASYNAAISA